MERIEDTIDTVTLIDVNSGKIRKWRTKNSRNARMDQI